MPHIQTLRLKIYYETYGQGEPLILIAGLASNYLSWLPVVPLLSPYFQVLIFDNRGVGQTESPDISYSAEMMAEDLHGLMTSLNISKAFILGHPQTLIGLKHQQEACRNLNANAVLDNIKAVTLVIGGEEDLLTPISNAKELVSKIATSTYLAVKGAHSWHLEQPDLFAKIVYEFFIE